MLTKIKDRIVSPSISLLEAMKLMDKLGVKILFVFRGNNFLGLITIGDIQRAIIKRAELSVKVEKVLNGHKIYASVEESNESIKAKMQSLRSECMPVIGTNGELVDVIFWNDLFGGVSELQRPKINLPVVIMAGGKGSRLKPITNVLPKPLIPVGEKTILEEIMDQFEVIGCKKFYMSVNYKYDMIKFYLSQLDKKYDIDFFMEKKPLGTIGSVALLKRKIATPFFVSNCDIRIDQDFRDVYDYHKNNNNDLTIITAIKSYKIPYGVIETGENGLMTGITEKPELSYMINTGVYIFNPELIDEIPENEFFHITHLIEKIRKRGGRVGCFPVSNGQWKDMGEWPEYLRMINVR